MRSPTPFAAFLTAAFGVSACSSMGMKQAMGDSAANELDTGGLDSAGDDSAPPADPAWFTPRAVVELADGAMAISQMTLIVVDSDLSTEICDIAVSPDAGVPAASPDPAAAVWMNVTLTASVDDCATLPSSIGIGIGELPGDVRAQLGPSGLEDSADSIYGAFARAPDAGANEVTAFGYAGTADGMAGEGAATLPPPDGEYVINPLFLLRIPDTGA